MKLTELILPVIAAAVLAAGAAAAYRHHHPVLSEPNAASGASASGVGRTKSTADATSANPPPLHALPQPIEAWTLEDFADLALVPGNDSDSD